MVFFDEIIKKEIKKGSIPKQIASTLKNSFDSLDKTKDFTMFDIKKLHSEDGINYFRLRKGKYRGIFYLDEEDIYVILIAKREEVYKKWQSFQ